MDKPTALLAEKVNVLDSMFDQEDKMKGGDETPPGDFENKEDPLPVN